MSHSTNSSSYTKTASLQNISLATSDFLDYNEVVALKTNSNDIEMLSQHGSALSIAESDIMQYKKEFKRSTVSESSQYQKIDNSDDSNDKILNGNFETGLYKEKSAKTTSYSSEKCCESVWDPQIKLIKDKNGKHKGFVRIYGKSFSYKQIIGFGIFFVSFVLIISAIAVNSWTFCEGTTASQHSILIIWSHNGLTISVGENASNSMKFKHIVSEVNNLDHSDIMKPLPTVFDTDYDYTKWSLIEKAINAQSDKRDMLSLLEWSDNNRVKDIEYGFNLMNLCNILCVCILALLMFLMLAFADKWYKLQYLLTFVSFVLLILSIIYWGIANQDIEEYNHMLWCHTGNSFIVLSTGLANLFLILFIFTLPKKQELHKYKYSNDIPTSVLSKDTSVSHIENIEMEQVSDEVSLGDTIKKSLTNALKSEMKNNIISDDDSLGSAILGSIEMTKVTESSHLSETSK